MLDQQSMQMLKGIKSSKRFFFEEENDNLNVQELTPDNQYYSQIKDELQSSLKSVTVEIIYLRVTKNNSAHKVELSGTIQGQIEFLFLYGVENGVYVTTNNLQLTTSYIESLRLLHIYNETGFASVCKTMLEDDNE